jgi:hypothetical protein
MDTDLSPIDVATHWPFLLRHLPLERWETGRRALDMLSQLQVDTGGDPVAMGRTRIAGSDLTPGEAGAVWRSLVELEERGVVARFRGRGRRPDAWTFRPDIAHWRTPWRYSGREVERAIDGCICRAECAVAARTPGQRAALPRVKEVFRIAREEHLFRPGLFLVDSRGFGAGRAATAQSPAWDPVDPRGNGERDGRFSRPVNSVGELVLNSQEEEVFQVLKRGAERRTEQPVFERSTPEREIKEVATRLNRLQAELLARKLWKREGKIHIGNVTGIMADLSTDREIVMAGREDGGRGVGSFTGLDVLEA